jgi:hypothetical protein
MHEQITFFSHRRGGQHSQLLVRKPNSGEHGRRTPKEALAVVGSMASRRSDENIAAVKPDGNTDWPWKNLDRAACPLAAQCKGYPRPPLRCEERRLAYDV